HDSLQRLVPCRDGDRPRRGQDLSQGSVQGAGLRRGGDAAPRRAPPRAGGAEERAASRRARSAENLAGDRGGRHAARAILRQRGARNTRAARGPSPTSGTTIPPTRGTATNKGARLDSNQGPRDYESPALTT